MPRVLLMFVVLFSFAAPAHAAVDTETQGYFDAAAAYWGQVSHCQDPQVIVDQAYVTRQLYEGRNAVALGLIGGCTMWVGDVYLSYSPGGRCSILAHEYGHWLGYLDHVTYSQDPLGIMGRFAWVPSCAADPRYPPAFSDPVLAAWQAYTPELLRWDARREARKVCMADAWLKAHRWERVRHRAACERYYPTTKPERPPL